MSWSGQTEKKLKTLGLWLHSCHAQANTLGSCFQQNPTLPDTTKVIFYPHLRKPINQSQNTVKSRNVQRKVTIMVFAETKLSVQLIFLTRGPILYDYFFLFNFSYVCSIDVVTVTQDTHYRPHATIWEALFCTDPEITLGGHIQCNELPPKVNIRPPKPAPPPPKKHAFSAEKRMMWTSDFVTFGSIYHGNYKQISHVLICPLNPKFAIKGILLGVLHFRVKQEVPVYNLDVVHASRKAPHASPKCTSLCHRKIVRTVFHAVEFCKGAR